MWAIIVALDNWSKILKSTTIIHQILNNWKGWLFKEHIQLKLWILYCSVIWTSYITINLIDVSFIFNNNTIITNKLSLSDFGTLSSLEKILIVLPPFSKLSSKSTPTTAIPIVFEIWYLWYVLTASGFIPSFFLAI